jgi:hypothetical protein
MPVLANAQALPSQAAPNSEAGEAPGIPSPFDDVAAGKIPAVTLAPIEGRQTDPAQEYIVQNFDKLPDLGLEYVELSKSHSVVFNPKETSAEELQAADKAGKLFDVAPLVRALGKDVVPKLQLAPAPAPAAGAPLAASAAAPAGPAAQDTAPAPGASMPSAPLATATASASPRVPSNRGMQAARLHNAAATSNDPVSLLSKRAK